MILIVDDDPEFLGAATATLALEGYQVLAARDAPRALDLVRRIGAEVNVALIDLSLGRSSGFELIQAIKTIDATLPVIAFSGVSVFATLESATAVGAIEVLRKPCSGEWRSAIERVRRDFPRTSHTASVSPA